MKNYYKFFLLLPCVLIIQMAAAQETCKVMMPSLEGQYEGDCKKGKAHGSGKAEGTDQYLGEFKDGLPHGKGVYRWKNGDFYEGEWQNGKKSGDGGMAYKRNGKADSVVTGFWKNNTYVGKYEKPFKVYSRTLQITKSDVKFEGAAVKEITILISNTTGNMPTLGGGVTPKATLGAIVMSKGAYVRMVSRYANNKQTAYKLEGVNFPFRARFRIGNQEADVEFLEDGKYTLDIALNN